MSQIFKIGESYENLIGAFTVLAITPPKMQIQYQDGTHSTVDINIQTRIQERIHDELDLARQEYERQTYVTRSKINFTGLIDDDFKDNVAGTNWRSRNGLGGLVSQNLSDLSGQEFSSVAIYRRPQAFIYPPHLPMFNQTEGVKLPKFVVRLNTENVLYGFYIEKSDELMGSDWHWPHFLDVLSGKRWQHDLALTMSEWDLKWILRFEEKMNGSQNYLVSDETVITGFGESYTFPKFSDFVAYLRTLPDQQWCNLFLANTMGKEEAINRGVNISQPISLVLNALVPFYSELLRHPSTTS